MAKRPHGNKCQCFFCTAWDTGKQKTKMKKCEKCGRVLPIDTPDSVYGCAAGIGCADYSKTVRRLNPWDHFSVHYRREYGKEPDPENKQTVLMASWYVTGATDSAAHRDLWPTNQNQP